MPPHPEPLPSLPDRTAAADLATPPDDWEETLLRAIEAGRNLPSPDDDPNLAEALAAYQKIESLFSLLRGPADVPPEPQPERFGRYMVRGTLGTGAFGTVYLADDPELGRPVAIKAPRAASLSLRERAGVSENSLSLRERAGVRAVSASADSDSLSHRERAGVRASERADQIASEARLAARLNHPAIVAIYDVGRDGDRPYIVMEYVPGETLEALLTSSAAWGDLPRSPAGDGLERPPLATSLEPSAHGTRLSFAQSAELLAAVADALHYAHKLGFVHRDLKPSNILIDAHGRPHVADFGLAVSEATQRQFAGQLAGTPAYMSPEQVRGEAHHLDGRTDIWSLGVIGYQLLTGRQPFWRGDMVACLDEIQHRDPKPPRQIDDAVPPELERIVLKCLAKRPTERYTTAADLATEMRRWLRSQPSGHATGASMGRHIALIAAVLLGVALTAWGWRVMKNTPEEMRFPTGESAGAQNVRSSSPLLSSGYPADSNRSPERRAMSEDIGVAAVTLQIVFTVPEGMIFSLVSSANKAPAAEPLIAPGAIDLQPGRYQLILKNVPGREFARFDGTLNIPPPSESVQRFLGDNSVQIRFTEEEFDDVLLGNSVTKVAFLVDVDREDYLPALQWLTSTGSGTRRDPRGDAADRGVVVLALILRTRKQLPQPKTPHGTQGR